VPFYGRLLKVAEFREGYFEFGPTDGIGGGPPARAEHDDGIETVNADPLAEGSRARLGAAEGVAYLRFFVGHGTDHPALCQRMSPYVL